MGVHVQQAQALALAVHPQRGLGHGRHGATGREDNGGMSDAAERLRLRYPPPRVPRPLLIALVAVGVIVGLVWLIWAALFHSTPAVAGQMSGSAWSPTPRSSSR